MASNTLTSRISISSYGTCVVKVCKGNYSTSWSGDITGVANFTVVGSNSKDCCTSTTGTCLQSSECPYVFGQIDWDSSYTDSEGNNYILATTTGGKGSAGATATYTLQTPTVKTYTLTITYSGYIKSDEYYYIEEGTTVYPSSYGSINYIDQSVYYVSSRYPSSSFKMTGDTTITIYCEERAQLSAPLLTQPSTDTSGFSIAITNNQKVDEVNVHTNYGTIASSSLGSYSMTSCSGSWATYGVEEGGELTIKVYFTKSGYTQSSTSTYKFTRPTKISYPLTLIYIDSSTNKEIKREFTTETFVAGDKITPGLYGEAPEGYTISSRDPSYYFYFKQGDSIKIYCEPASTTPYPLYAKYIYGGKVLDTVVIDNAVLDGTAIVIYNSSNLDLSVKKRLPTGYNVSNYSPNSFTFKHSTNDTITVNCSRDTSNYTWFNIISKDTDNVLLNNTEVGPYIIGRTIQTRDFYSNPVYTPDGYNRYDFSPQGEFPVEDLSVVTIYWQKITQLDKPVIYDVITVSHDNFSFKAYNGNSVEVDLYVDGVRKATISPLSNTSDYLTYKWGEDTSKTMNFYFTNSSYTQSDTLSYTFKRPESIELPPVINIKTRSNTSCIFSITNNNKYSVHFEGTRAEYKYSSPNYRERIPYSVERKDILKGETFELEYAWKDGIMLMELSGYFTDTSSDTSSRKTNSATTSIEEIKLFNAPTVTLDENTTSLYRLNITNPNKDSGVLYLVDNDTNETKKIGELAASASIIYKQNWGDAAKLNYSFYLIRVLDGYTSSSTLIEIENYLSRPQFELLRRDEKSVSFCITNNNNNSGIYSCCYVVNPATIPNTAYDISSNSNAITINNFYPKSSLIFTASGWDNSNNINIYACFYFTPTSTAIVEKSLVASLIVPALVLNINYYRGENLYQSRTIIKGEDSAFFIADYKMDITGYKYSTFTLDNEKQEGEKFFMNGESHTINYYYVDENAGKYNLTITEYRDGSSYGLSRTDSITEGETVFISTYINTYENYAFDHSVPGGESFIMPASEKTLDLYYVTSPQLTVEYYKNKEIDTSLTVLKAFKSTDKVNIHDFEIAIDGYSFKNSDPEENFIMGTAPRTLKMYYINKTKLEPPFVEATSGSDYTIEQYKFNIGNPNENICNLLIDSTTSPWAYNIAKGGIRTYSGDWKEDEYSRVFKLYAAPISSESEEYQISDATEFTVKRLQKPILTYIENEITYNTYKIFIKNNSSNPLVNYSVDGVTQTNSIKSNGTATYTKEWDNSTKAGSSKQIKVKFLGTEEYGPSEAAIEIKRPEEFKAPEITLVSTYSGYTVKIHNPNKTISPKYSIYKNSQTIPLNSGTILNNEDASYVDIEYKGIWEDSEKPDTEITIKVEFTATPKYTDTKTTSDTIERPEQGQLSKPKLRIITNETDYFILEITNPNSVATYTNSTTDNGLNSIQIPKNSLVTKTINWTTGEDIKVIGVSLKYAGTDDEYKESRQAEITINKGIVAPVINILSNSYNNCIIDIINSNPFEVEFTGNITNTSTGKKVDVTQKILAEQDLLYPILWNEYNSNALVLNGKFTQGEITSSEISISLNRPIGLEQPLLEQIFDSDNFLSFSITNRNDATVYSYIDGYVWLTGYNSGTPLKLLGGSTVPYLLSQKVPDNTKYEIYFKNIEQGVQSDISIINLSTTSPDITLKPEIILEKNSKDNYAIRIINWNLFSVTAHIFKKGEEQSTQNISGLNSNTIEYNWMEDEESFNYSVYFTKDNYNKSLTSSLLIPKINYYNLEIVYFGANLEKETYGPFKEGTVIDPLNYGKIAQGYMISKRSIEKDFPILYDTILYITEVPILKAPVIEKKDNKTTYCSYQITNTNNVNCTFVGTLKGYHYLGRTILLENISVNLSSSETTIFPILWEKGITYDTLELSGFLEARNYGDSSNSASVKIIKHLNKPIITLDPDNTTAKKYSLIVNNNNSDNVDLYSDTDQMIIGGIKSNDFSYYTRSWNNTLYKKVYFKRVSDGAVSEQTELNLATPITLNQPNITSTSELNDEYATFTISNPNEVDSNFVFDIRDTNNKIIISGSIIVEALKSSTYKISWDSVNGASNISISGYLEQIHAIYNASSYASANAQKQRLQRIQDPLLTEIISTKEKISMKIQNPNNNNVDLYINNVKQTSSIAGKDFFIYEKSWGENENEKIIQVYFYNQDYIYPWSTIKSQTFERPQDTVVVVDTLANTKWALNKTLNTGSVHTVYNINGICDNYNFTALNVGYNGDTSTANYISITTSSGKINIVENGLPLYKQINFTTGTDIENTNLINWIKANATKLYTTYDLSQIMAVGGDYTVTVKAIASGYTNSNDSQSLTYRPYDISNAKLKGIKANSTNATTLSDGDVTWLEFEAATGYTLPDLETLKKSVVEGATVNKWFIKDE